MKKNLLITLSVMVLLTIIVGFTAYNITDSWINVTTEVNRNISKEIILQELVDDIDKITKRAELYSIYPTNKLKNDLYDLHKTIVTKFTSLKFLSSQTSFDRLDILLIQSDYDSNIYALITKMIQEKSASLHKNTSKLTETLLSNNAEIQKRINKLKTNIIPSYEENINNLKNYSVNVTLTITCICVFLGIIMMTISVKQLTSLYEKIEKQAKKEKLVSELTTAVCSTLDLDIIFNKATEELFKAMKFDICLILEYDENEGIIIRNEFINNDSDTIQSYQIYKNLLSKNNKYLEECNQTRNPVVINLSLLDLDIYPELKAFDFNKNSVLLLVPIILHNDELYGFILIDSFNNNSTSKDNIETIVDLANQLSIAISNAQLYHNAQAKTMEASSLAMQLEKNLEEIKKINEELISSNELNVRIQEAERLRIARDLHDESIQGLIGLIRKTDYSIDNDKIQNITEIHNELKQITNQIRRICQNLRPSILDDLGLHSAIEWLVDDLEKYGIVANLSFEESNYTELPNQTELIMFRVIQELTNNIKKHSKATNAWLALKYDNAGIFISIKDDGQGFEYKEDDLTKTMGLIGIKERIKSVSGNINIVSEINSGTEVSIFIPIISSINLKIEEEITV